MKTMLLALCCCLLSGCGEPIYKDRLPGILGVDTVEILDSDFVHEFAGFGEYYDFEQYQLSAQTVRTFLANLHRSLPELKTGSTTWLQTGWAETPFDSSMAEIEIMCLNYDSGNQKLSGRLRSIKKLISGPGTYYACYYTPDKYRVDRTELYIVDVNSNMLYAIASDD